MFTQEHEEMVKKVFDQLPSARLSGDFKDEVKYINLGLLTSLVERMMTQAYHDGKMSGLTDAEIAISTAFSH
jgi:hypothetical protein